MAATINPANIAIVLVQPNISENIGAAARAMCNMGLRRLILVNPPRCDLTRVCKMATHAALDVVEEMEVYAGLPEALREFSYVVGTTARLGGERQVVGSPARLAEMLVPISAENRIAILFGPEDRGLTNEDLRLCHTLATIPTADFSSLNLAQAVMVICYELFRCSIDPPQEFAPRLANRFELDAMYAQLQDVLRAHLLHQSGESRPFHEQPEALRHPHAAAGEGDADHPGHLPADRLVRQALLRTGPNVAG